MIQGLTAVNNDSGLGDNASDRDIQQPNEDFHVALKLLTQNLAQSSNAVQFLHELPWYAVIGPANSGKSTVLKNSGLDFPLLDKYGKAEIPGIGGTGNCDWWFTNKAVLLEIAGRFNAQGSEQRVDRAQWTRFLGILKKYRPRPPLNGVMVVMGLDDLTRQTERDHKHQAHAIRQRIEEMSKELGLRIPVYMVFTKCDSIAGFSEFFSDLGRDARDQVWGETFPEANPLHSLDFVEVFIDRFDELVQRLNIRVRERIQNEPNLQKRSKIFGFPQQISILKTPIHKFLSNALGAWSGQDQPLLRGVYFTSGQQMDSSIDLISDGLAKSFNLDRPTSPATGGKGHSYFIKRLLNNVILNEAGMAGIDPKNEKRKVWIQRAAYGGVLTFTALAVGLLSLNFAHNRSAISNQYTAIEMYQTLVAAQPDLEYDFDQILPRMNAAYIARDAFPEQATWLSAFGWYNGDEFRSKTDREYHRNLRDYFQPALKIRLERQLAAGQDINPDLLVQLLRVYLMMGDPDALQARRFKSWFLIDWSNLYSRYPQMQADLAVHLDNLLALTLESMPLDRNLIGKTRQTLPRQFVLDE